MRFLFKRNMSNYVLGAGSSQNRSTRTDCLSVEDAESGALGQYVTQQYELLQLVLSNLNVKDLRNAAQVCRAWWLAARAVQKSRLKPHTMVWYDVVGRRGESIEDSCRDVLDGQCSEPDLCLVFMNFAGCNRDECPVKSCSRCSKALACLRAQLLRRCLLVCIRMPFTAGFYSCVNCVMKRRDADAEAWAMMNPMVQGFAAAFIPRVAGVSVSVFHVRMTYYTTVQWKDCLEEEDLDRIPGLPPTSMPLRCLLFFHHFGLHNPGLIVRSLEARHGKFAVGGGLCKDATLAAAGFAPSDWCVFGIALSGRCVQAASLVLGPEQHASHVEGAFAKVQNCMGSMKNSIAIWFSPNEPNVDYQYDTRKVEYTYFRRHFPSVPLTGGYLLNKVGRTHLPGMPDEWKDKSLSQKMASVFVFISFTQQPVP